MTTHRFFRIAPNQFAHDMTGRGAELYGGRWNKKGTPAVYAAQSIALATLEKLVHTEGIVPVEHSLMALDEVDMAEVKQFNMSDLSESWFTMANTAQSQQFAMDHLFTPGRLGILVPSIVVPEEHNLVLNPRHPKMANVRISRLRPFDLDHRLIPGRMDLN